ncbi:MAG: HAD family hydrolase [Bacteroidetes bacterium]|nr:HAD family hydrolase [Bacteroidota bacterium]
MIQAITIDFWNTIVDSRNGERRRAARNQAMAEVFNRVGRPWDEQQVAAAFEHSYETFERHWHGEQRTMRAAESLDVIWRFLGIEVPEDAHARMITQIEDSILEGMPGLLPGCAEALAELAARVPLVLISDTAFSPGRVLRRVLEQHDIAGFFRDMVFSDETGVSKPHPMMFERALAAAGASAGQAVHIGDIERTDIAGARAMGMRSILFRGDESGRYHHENTEDRTAADAVAQDWHEVRDILVDWGVS